MRILFVFPVLLFFTSFSSCKEQNRNVLVNEHRITLQNIAAKSDSLDVAYFAAGCFWCVEAIFESVGGVVEAVSGYSGGTSKDPTYEKVSRGKTDHAEAVAVYYQPEEVDFRTLVEVFFGSHDPTTPDQQGPDKGPQYRSIAFYNSDEEKKIIEQEISRLNQEKAFRAEIVTQVVPFKVFYPAEDYHQDYERLNPDNPYVRAISIPRLLRFKKKYPELLKEKE